MTLAGKNILLVISGGIAAYKSLELIRLIRKAGGKITPILTKSGEEFVTPLSVAALSESNVYTDLFSLKDETEMGHIRLSREADLIVVAPATADLMAKIANGLANDLASTTLLAANKQILVVPAMNHMMWENPATKENIQTLSSRGIQFVGPVEGDMACGEYGMGRMVEPEAIMESIEKFFGPKPLAGFKILVTAGPTQEPIDPVRYISNRSSGKQGYAIAEALANEGADVTLVSGPTYLVAPKNVNMVRVETAIEMLDASMEALPADIAICSAAVADWRPENAADHKIKKDPATGNLPPELHMTENPDILKTISRHPNLRPRLVIGFAAETENTMENALKKIESKGCNWIVANQVGDKSNPVFGQDTNEVILVSSDQHEAWPTLSKQDVARRLVQKIILCIENQDTGSCLNQPLNPTQPSALKPQFPSR